MRKGKRKKGRIFNRFEGLPKALIWGWGIWSVAVLTTLLILYAPPLHSVKKSAISLISNFLTSDKEVQPEKLIKPRNTPDFVVKLDSQPADKEHPTSPVSPDSGSDKEVTYTKPVEPGSDHDVTINRNNRTVETGQISETQSTPFASQADSVTVVPAPELSAPTDKQSAPAQKNTEDTLLIEAATHESDTVKTTVADLKFFRSHPDAVSHGENSKVTNSVGVETVSGADPGKDLTTNLQETVKPEISDFRRQPEIGSAQEKQLNTTLEKSERSEQAEEAPTVDSVDDNQKLVSKYREPESLSKNIAGPSSPNSEEVIQPTESVKNNKTPASELSEQQSENRTPRQVKGDIKRFKTQDKQKYIAEWEKLNFRGVDQNGNVVEMTLLVLSGDFYWRFGGQSIINNDGQVMRVADHLASPSLRAAIKDSQGIISVGTASEEGDLRLEEFRATLRANRLLSLVIQTQPQINAIYTLGLGQYQKRSSTDSTNDLNPSSNDQRRVILISISHQDPNANLAEAVKNGLSAIPGLPYELGHFSHFDLKNRASAL